MFEPRVYLLLSVGFVTVALGDYVTKLWTVSRSPTLLLCAWACYLVVTGIWFVVISTQPELGRVGTVWTTCGMVAAVATGVLIFGEDLSGTNRTGILLCILGVILTSL